MPSGNTDQGMRVEYRGRVQGSAYMVGNGARV